MSKSKVPPDPVRIIESLDADQIAARLAELAAEQHALRVLLRSARARHLARQGPAGRPPASKGGS